MTIQKKTVLCLAAIALALVLAATGGYAVLQASADRAKTYPEENTLFIPPLIDSRDADHRIELALQNASHEFFAGIKSDTKGFGQTYLGPSIRLYKGDSTRITFQNKMHNLAPYTATVCM